ncbi:MAG: SHOCT domain-containing protein [Actinobacteria bacterium]|nr:MAG: SHOCT domain-containing protein [Actinomycetota bacterium]
MMGYYGGYGACFDGIGRYGGGYGGHSLFAGLFWLLLIAGLIVLVVALLRRPHLTAGTVGAGVHHGQALDVVRERYARGEIDRDEYERLSKDLR